MIHLVDYIINILITKNNVKVTFVIKTQCVFNFFLKVQNLYACMFKWEVEHPLEIEPKKKTIP
jgi:hypothetical protein